MMGHLSPKIYIWHDLSFFLGRLPDNKEHTHHALQIQVGLKKSFKIFFKQFCIESRFAIILPDMPHRIDDNNEFQAVIYIEPESSTGISLQKIYSSENRICKKNFKIIEPYIEILHRYGSKICSCHEIKHFLDSFFEDIVGTTSLNQNIDKRILRAIEICRQAPNKSISAKTLSNKVNLSEGRFGHLFKEQMGISIRRYLLWLRLSDALMLLSKGGTATDAAHQAGFSDSAHLSRTYRKMYGSSLHNFARDSQFVQVIPCFE